MGQIAIQKDQTLTLLVIDIQENVKCFAAKNGIMKCRHDITCRDREGNTSVFEYVTPQNAPVMFYKGTWQLVRCAFINDKGATVEPVIDGSHPHLIETPAAPQQRESNNKKIGGAAYTFCLGFAKDLYAAILRRSDIGTEINSQGIRLVCQIAENIQGLLTLRVGVEGDDVNHYAQQIGGSSFLFALGFAKDLLCAEIAIRDIGSVLTDDDILRMFKWADDLQKNMDERLTF